MAILTVAELDELSNKMCKEMKAEGIVIDYNRPIINAALQAIEDWYETAKLQGSSDIDAATAPYGYTFTNPQKKKLFKWWLWQKFFRESV